MIDILKELADASRREILKELRTGPKRVSDIVATTGLKQPNVSNHLARLKARKWLKSEKVGREVLYSFADQEAHQAVCAAFARQTPDLKNADLQELADEYAKAAIHGEDEACSEIVCELVRRRADLCTIYSEVMGPAMRNVGQWYSSGTIDEGCEHIATGITDRIMSRVVQFYQPIGTIDRTAVLGCASGNRHTLALRMASDMLQAAGWKTIFLGGDLPDAAFARAIERHKPDSVFISCTSTPALEPTLDLVRQLNKKDRDYRIGVGGSFVKDHEEEFKSAGVDLLVSSLREFVDKIVR